MSDFSDDDIQDVWEKGKVVGGKPDWAVVHDEAMGIVMSFET